LNDDTNAFKDALDAARYQSRIRELIEEQEAPITVEQAPLEDESDLEITRDTWGRMIVKYGGRVTYYEGKTDDAP
jgi:hypothetical protein